MFSSRTTAKPGLSQRGIRETDLDLVLAHGTEIGRDRIMLMARDAAKLIRARKQEIAKIERLTGKVLVVSNGQPRHGLPPDDTEPIVPKTFETPPMGVDGTSLGCLRTGYGRHSTGRPRP